jgi:hypothetical protein
MTTILDRLGELYPEVRELLDTDVESMSVLKAGQLVNALAGALLVHTADLELELDAQARREAKGRELLAMADRSRSELLGFRLAEVRRMWVDQGGRLCPVCRACVSVGDEGELLEVGEDDELHLHRCPEVAA